MKHFLTLCHIIAILVGGVATIVPTTVSAAFGDASDYILLAPIPGTYNDTSCSQGTTNTYTNAGVSAGNNSGTTNCRTDFVTYIKGFFRLVISLSSIIAVLVITFEGFKLVVSTSEGARETAKDRIQQALIGLGLVLGSYLILNTINPQLTKISFVVDKVRDYAGTSAYFEERLGSAQAAEQLRLENREANANFSAQATPLMQQLEALGDCNDPEQTDPEACFTEQSRLEGELTALRNSTDVLAYTNGFKGKIITEVQSRLTPPATPDSITAARRQLVAAWSTVLERTSMLQSQGRATEAEALLAAATEIHRQTTADIDHRQRCPNGDTIQTYGVGGAMGGAGFTTTPCI